MSITSITKKSYMQELIHVDEVTANLNKVAKDAIAHLEDEKSAISRGEKSKLNKSKGELDRNITEIKSQHSMITSKLQEKHQIVKQRKESIDVLEKNIAIMDKNMDILQAEKDTALETLQQKKAYLRDRLGSIEKLDVLINALTYQIYDMTHDHDLEMEALQKKREDILNSDMTRSEMSLALKLLDQEIEDAENRHKDAMQNLEEQRLDLKEESLTVTQNLNEDVQAMRDERNKKLDRIRELEAMKLNASPSELIEINRQLAELNKELDELDGLFDNEIAGFSHLNSQEKLARLLELRCLRLTPSGRILTGSGRIMTIDEAKRAGLLEGLEAELMRMRGFTMTPSGHILTRSGNLLSPSEAEKLGYLHDANRNDLIYEDTSTATISSSESSNTITSGMSSSDVHYLKMVVGKPLTLAIAEITAKQPKDPIHFLGHWLFKYRYNQEVDEIKKHELQELINERERLAKIQFHLQAQEDAKATLLDLLGRVDVAIEQREIEAELRRIEEEAAAREAENEELAQEARDTLGVYDGPTAGQKL